MEDLVETVNKGHIHQYISKPWDDRDMRRLLAGYVIRFNHRYGRTCRLFRNRYTSILCREAAYFKELIRYGERAGSECWWMGRGEKPW